MRVWISKDGKAFCECASLAEAWLRCLDEGFVILENYRGRPGMPGMGQGRQRARLIPGVHVIDERTLGQRKPTPPHGRGKGSKKLKFKPENWVDAL